MGYFKGIYSAKVKTSKFDLKFQIISLRQKNEIEYLIPLDSFRKFKEIKYEYIND